MAQQGSPVRWPLREDNELRRLVWDHVLSQAPPPLRRPWCLISTLLAASLGTEPRGRKQCRTRWDDFLNMVIKKGPWSAQEDHQLLCGVQTHGFRAWTTIARKCVEGRTPSACRSHFKLLCGGGALACLGSHELLPQAPAAPSRRRGAAKPRPPAAPKPGGRPSKGGNLAVRKGPAAAAAAAPPSPPTPAAALPPKLPPLPQCGTVEALLDWDAPIEEWDALLPVAKLLVTPEALCCSCLQPPCCGCDAGLEEWAAACSEEDSPEPWSAQAWGFAAARVAANVQMAAAAAVAAELWGDDDDEDDDLGLFDDRRQFLSYIG